MSDTDFLERYNKAIDRIKKAEMFMEKATPNRVDKWLGEYNLLVNELSFLMNWYIKKFGFNDEYYILFINY